MCYLQKASESLIFMPTLLSLPHAPLQGTNVFPFLSSSYMMGFAMMIISFLHTFKISYSFFSCSFWGLFSSNSSFGFFFKKELFFSDTDIRFVLVASNFCTMSQQCLN